MVQRLRLCTPKAESIGSILGGGIKTPYASWCSQKLKLRLKIQAPESLSLHTSLSLPCNPNLPPSPGHFSNFHSQHSGPSYLLELSVALLTSHTPCFPQLLYNIYPPLPHPSVCPPPTLQVLDQGRVTTLVQECNLFHDFSLT